MEAIINIRRITSLNAKFRHAVSALSTEVVEDFQNVVDTPHGDTSYDYFKSTMLHCKFPSVRKRFQQLLNEEVLGHLPPS